VSLCINPVDKISYPRINGQTKKAVLRINGQRLTHKRSDQACLYSLESLTRQRFKAFGKKPPVVTYIYKPVVNKAKLGITSAGGLIHLEKKRLTECP